ncbi:MAG: transposase [Acidobacteriaceae bacterium]|nr:transposase [Acidobacteriaceae bacterium]
MGRPAKDRLALAAAFIAKAVYGIETTRGLIEQMRQDRQLRCICGWNSACRIPHASTFSRATPPPSKRVKAFRSPTRKRKGRSISAAQARQSLPARHAFRDRQRKQALAEQLATLPQECSIGTKKSSKGHQQYWRGYKLHLDVADGKFRSALC